MADDKTLISSEENKFTSLTESLLRELDSLRHDMALIRSDMSSLTVRLDDGVDILNDAAALVAVDQSSIEDRASRTMQLARAVSAIAGAIGDAETQVDFAEIKMSVELKEMRDDERRADALRRGVIPFAGGAGTHSILSVLFGAHSIGEGIFSFLTMIDSNALRLLCKEFRQAVMDFPWMDAESHITGSVKAWRAAFPHARADNVSDREDIVDADFVHIRGDARVRLHTVNMMWGCKSVTDAAFVHLRGIHTLHISHCNQATITDAAFVHLRGIHTLYMPCCDQPTITDAAFMHLRGIHTLKMWGCNQLTITDAAFVHLRGIHTLDMCYCNQATITDAAIVHLRGICDLKTTGCSIAVKVAAAAALLLI